MNNMKQLKQTAKKVIEDITDTTIEDISGKLLHCCHCGCDVLATFEIIHGRAPNDYTFTCDEHLVEMLTDASHHELIALPQLEEERSQSYNKSEEINCTDGLKILVEAAVASPRGSP